MKKHMKIGLISAVAVLSATINNAQATAIAEGSFLWDSLVVTSNGNDVTSSISFPTQTPAQVLYDPYDSIEASYQEGSDNKVELFEEKDPNPNFGTGISINDGGSVTSIMASNTSTLLSAQSRSEYTSKIETVSYRQGTFIAPETGTYTFGIDITGRTELSNQNTDGNSGLQAYVSYDFQFINLSTQVDQNPNQAGHQNDGNFVFKELYVESLNASAKTVNETISITDSFDTPISVIEGDEIFLYTTLTTFADSVFSQAPPTPSPVPVPAALWLLSGAALMFKPFVRRVRAG